MPQPTDSTGTRAISIPPSIDSPKPADSPHATSAPQTFTAHDPRPIYAQIAAELRNSIGDGSLSEETRAPSIHELARFYSVNPTTSSKALTMLVDEGLLEKRRGLGMFVLRGAQKEVVRRRREAFAAQFVTPFIEEATAIGLGRAELHALIDERWQTAPATSTTSTTPTASVAPATSVTDTASVKDPQ